MSEKQQTAVGWLVQQLSKEWMLEGRDLHLIEKANEKFEQQITNAVKHGNSFEQGDLRCELYFEKTFKK